MENDTTTLQGTAPKTAQNASSHESRDHNDNYGISDDHTPVLRSRMKDASSVLPDAMLMKRTAVWAMLFCVFTDAMTVKCVVPNYAFMTLPGAHPDSFPDTEPFEYVTAQYMIHTAAATGAFFSDLGAGWLSDHDHVGRRRMILVNLLGSIVFTIVKYLARHNYWTFVSMTFVAGCFSSTPSLGMAYMAELFMDDRAEADIRMGHVMAVILVGQSAGGLLSVITPNDLFFPLIFATVILLCGFVVGYFFLFEPNQCHERRGQSEKEEHSNKNLPKTEEVDNISKKMPPIRSVDNCTLYNVVFGSLADHAGSLGIVPLALSPLMFETFHFNLVDQGLQPIMSEQAYRLLYSMLAMAVIPATFLAPWLFRKIGVALSCVIFNLLTGCFIISLLYIALIEPATKTTFAFCASLLYTGFSLTAVSQFTTGPMLDRITPIEKKGFVQGIAYSVYDASQAVFPFVYAMIVGYYGISATMWICVGMSCFATLVNLPLLVHPRLQRESQIEKDTGVGASTRTVPLLLLEDEEDKLRRMMETSIFYKKKQARNNHDRIKPY